MSEEELETTEGEGVDLLAQLLELVGWSEINFMSDFSKRQGDGE